VSWAAGYYDSSPDYCDCQYFHYKIEAVTVIW
jgi:hypothetical protein